MLTAYLAKKLTFARAGPTCSACIMGLGVLTTACVRHITSPSSARPAKTGKGHGAETRTKQAGGPSDASAIPVVERARSRRARGAGGRDGGGSRGRTVYPPV